LFYLLCYGLKCREDIRRLLKNVDICNDDICNVIVTDSETTAVHCVSKNAPTLEQIARNYNDRF